MAKSKQAPTLGGSREGDMMDDARSGDAKEIEGFALRETGRWGTDQRPKTWLADGRWSEAIDAITPLRTIPLDQGGPKRRKKNLGIPTRASIAWPEQISFLHPTIRRTWTDH